MNRYFRWFKLKILLYRLKRHIELMETIVKITTLVHEVPRNDSELEMFLNIFDGMEEDITLKKKHLLNSFLTSNDIHVLSLEAKEAARLVRQIIELKNLKNHSQTKLETVFSRLEQLEFDTRTFLGSSE